jgi:hypothetical protein
MSLDEELIKKEKLETGVRRIRWQGDWPLKPGEVDTTERYTKVEDYDPVLRSHCGLYGGLSERVSGKLMARMRFCG